jgi:hypothetical protein
MQPMKVALGLTDAQAGCLQTVFFLGMAAFDEQETGPTRTATTFIKEK